MTTDSFDAKKYHGSDVAAALLAGMTLADVRQTDDGLGNEFVVLPQGTALHSLEPIHSTPYRQRGTDEVANAASLVEHIRRYASVPAAVPLYADVEKEHVVAIYDDCTPALAAWRQHRVVLRLARHPAWSDWLKVHHKPVGQSDFADFLEDRMEDLVDPTTADLLEIVRDLRGHKGARWQSAYDPRTGDRTLTWAEETTMAGVRKGDVTVPETITLAVPLWQGEALTRIEARLRVRVEEGTLAFVVVLPDPIKLHLDAMGAITARIAADTGGTLFFGKAAAL